MCQGFFSKERYFKVDPRMAKSLAHGGLEMGSGWGGMKKRKMPVKTQLAEASQEEVAL